MHGWRRIRPSTISGTMLWFPVLTNQRTVRAGNCGDCPEGGPQAEFGRFIKSVENLPEIITRFDEALWGSLVEKVTVYSKDRIVFTMTSGMEIEV